MDYISGVLLILGDPGAVSRAGRKGATRDESSARLTAPGSPRMASYFDLFNA